MANARERILPPYTRRVNDFRHLAIKSLAVVLLLGFAMFLGFWLAIFGQMIIVGYVGILALFLLLAFWMAPETGVDYRSALNWQFCAYLATMMAWPGYVALNIPGLPWISPSRLFFAILTFTFLLQISQSAAARKQIMDVAGYSKNLLLLYGLFILTQIITIPLSTRPATSAREVITFIVMWNIPMLIGLFVLAREDMVKRLYHLILWCAAIVFVLGLGEYHMEQVVWANYIPKFLQVDGKLSELLLDSARRDDGRYRMRGMFPVALYFGQFVALMTPFMMHAAFTAKPKVKPWAYGFLVLVIFMAWATNTRTAFVGMLLGLVLYAGVFALRRYFNPKNQVDVVGPMAALAAPAFVIVMGVLIAASKTLQTWTIGGAQHSGSDVVRDMQWTRALSALSTNPIGYGAGRAPEIAGKPTRTGDWIIDSYWINLLLDYGVVGFAAFMLFFLILAYQSIMDSLRHSDETTQICGVFGMVLIILVLTMYTLSFEGNFYLPMILAAAIMGNRYRLSKRIAAEKKTENNSAHMALRAR